MSSATKIHKFDKLYQRKANEKVYVWNIEVREKSGYAIIHTEYGQLDGKQVIKDTEIHAGKAGRSIIEQALSEARSDWNKKVNKGGYIKDLKDAKTKLNIKPMLAHNFRFSDQKDKKGYSIPLPALAEPKYDGNRCIAFYDSEAKKVVLKSRSGKVIVNFTDIESRLAKEVYAKIKNAATFYLDGELYTDKLPFNELNGVFRREKNLTTEDYKKIDLVNYYIYDCFDTANQSMPQMERKEFLEKAVDKKDKKLILVKYYEVKTEAEIKKRHEEFVKEGFEGIILRDKNGVYELNKRSRYLLKYKDFADEEFKVVGYHISNDAVPTVVWECETNEEVDGKRGIFSVKPQGTQEERAYLLEHAKEYIGKMLTVKYQEYTDDVHGIPRFPTAKDFRDPAEIDE